MSDQTVAPFPARPSDDARRLQTWLAGIGLVASDACWLDPAFVESAARAVDAMLKAQESRRV